MKRKNLCMTLTQLENRDYGEPPFPSYLVKTIHALRHKPIGAFTTEDLRISLGQARGVPYLLPLAVDVLEEDPFAEGDCYPGDLLKACTTLPMAVLKAHPVELAALVTAARKVLLRISDPYGDDYDHKFQAHLENFVENSGLAKA